MFHFRSEFFIFLQKLFHRAYGNNFSSNIREAFQTTRRSYKIEANCDFQSLKSIIKSISPPLRLPSESNIRETIRALAIDRKKKKLARADTALFDSCRVCSHERRSSLITSGSTTVRGCSKNSNSAAFQSSSSLHLWAIIFCLSLLFRETRRSHVAIALYSRAVVACVPVYSPKYTLCTQYAWAHTGTLGAVKEGGISRESRVSAPLVFDFLEKRLASAPRSAASCI